MARPGTEATWRPFRAGLALEHRPGPSGARERPTAGPSAPERGPGRVAAHWPLGRDPSRAFATEAALAPGANAPWC